MAKAKKKFEDDSGDHFRHFAKSLENTIATHGENFEGRQKLQLEKLLRLEHKFRITLIKHRWGNGVYKAFVKMICDEKRNILSARPFFRERQEIFTKYISKALKARQEKGLYRFRFNYQFITFVMALRQWAKKSKIRKLFLKIDQIRNEILEMNLPLGIFQGRKFYNKTPKSHLTHMDFIQISCEGLMAGLDKYTPTDGIVIPRAFTGVAIGRMVGNFIEEYSETPIHFYPGDKRKIYRANKAVGRMGKELDYEKVAVSVNTDDDGKLMTPDRQTNPDEIAALMMAASCVSADSTISQDPEAPEPIARFAAPESARPDVQFEDRQAMSAMAKAFRKLTPWERKFLRLRGVDIGKRVKRFAT